MGEYTDSVLRFLQYFLKVLPEARECNGDFVIGHKINPCTPHSRKVVKSGDDFPSLPDTSMLYACYLSLYPGTDRSELLSLVFKLYTLAGALAAYRSRTGTTDDVTIRRLYDCLAGAVDLSKNGGCVLCNPVKTIGSGKKEPACTECLSDQIRFELTSIVSYPAVAPKIRRYIQLYLDLQSYRYFPQRIRSGYLETWSTYYMKRYQDINCSEFCAASDSLLGIIAMLAAATDPNLDTRETGLLDEACFPWLCGLDSLLRSYIGARCSNSQEDLNYMNGYKNLKACEERLLFFTAKAEEACQRLQKSTFFLSLIRIMTGICLTDPEAGFGLCRLTSRNILKGSSPRTLLCSQACRIARQCQLL